MLRSELMPASSTRGNRELEKRHSKLPGTRLTRLYAHERRCRLSGDSAFIDTFGSSAIFLCSLRLKDSGIQGTFNGINHVFEDPRSPDTQLAVTGQPLVVLVTARLSGVLAPFLGL